MPLAGFPPKVVSTIKFQNLLQKTNSGGPQGSLRLRMSKFGSIILKHKNSNISKSNGSSNFSHKVPCLHAHNPAKFKPSTPNGSKVIAKKVQFQFLSRPLDQFLSRPSNLAKYYIIRIHMKFPFKTTAQFNRNFLSRPLYSPSNITGIKPSQNTNSDHFKTLLLVYFQDHGRWTAHFSATKV